jgi:hypothetical protein
MSGDETEPCRHFDTEGRVDQEHLEAAIRATPVETRPLLDLEKLRASFEFGPSQREPTAVVSPVRYARGLLRRIEQLVGELLQARGAIPQGDRQTAGQVPDTSGAHRFSKGGSLGGAPSASSTPRSNSSTPQRVKPARTVTARVASY